MIASVIVDISNSNVDKIFDYLIPSDMGLLAGDRVLVPFGSRSIEGFCISIKLDCDCDRELKSIISKLDSQPLITDEMLHIMELMKSKFYIRYIDSLRLFIPSKLRGGRVKELLRDYLTINNELTAEDIDCRVGSRAKSQIAVLDRLQCGGEFLTVLNSEYSNSAINALIDKGVLIKSKQEVMRTPHKYIEVTNNKVRLTDSQDRAFKEIINGDNNILLLHGVTGSGKTEVYLNAIEEMLKQGKTAIMLVPEISLTPQMLRIFRGRFGEIVAMLHSGLSDGERYDEWRRLLTGDAKIAIGARSAIFSPQQNIGIIIIDEEHDGSYSSESNPRYNTYQVAKWRRDYNECKLVLGSATPSIDSYLVAKNHEIGLIEMPDRISNRGMPKIKIVDMALELRDGNLGIFSRELASAIHETIDRNEQVMIFLNRRGYASFMLCKACGYVAKCSDCDVSLTYHSEDNMLKCHYCGKKFKPLNLCPCCGSDKIRMGKVGTQRIVEDLNKMLPNVHILRMDNDTVNTKNAYLEILSAFGAKEAQILVGTQMIAKGHDFKDVTLVAVLDADMGLYHSDYRSSERTYQLITQVAGRAGRAEKGGQVIIQSYSPKHYLYNFIKNYDYLGFFEKEINTRQITKFPPFTTIIRVLLSSTDESTALDITKDIYTELKKIKENTEEDFIYLQAMKAPVGMIQQHHRYQIIMRITRQHEDNIIEKLHVIVDSVGNKNISKFIEINPQNLS